MHLLKLTEFMTEVYAPGQISIDTLRGEIRRGELIGGFIKPNGTYWVDRDEFEKSIKQPSLIALEDIVSEMDDVTMKALAY